MRNKNRNGFTLVELLVVISILGVLVSVALAAFRSSQVKGRDAQRKSDLKQMSSALELYYSDYGQYPTSGSNKIAACPSTTATVCPWGTGEFTDGRTIYFKTLPLDPVSTSSYYYRIVDAGINQKFQLFAHLENSQDPNCLSGNCASSPVSYLCGGSVCNFAITSPNTSATE